MENIEKNNKQMLCNTRFENTIAVTYYDANTGCIRILCEIPGMSGENSQPCASPLFLTRGIKRRIKEIRKSHANLEM